MSAEDLFPEPEDAEYVAILKCTECGSTGHCYSDSEIVDEYQWWDCQVCGAETVKHDIVMQTTRGEVIQR